MSDKENKPSNEWESRWHVMIYEEIQNMKRVVESHLDENRKENKELRKKIDELRNNEIVPLKDEVSDIKVELARLKIKAGIWGTIGASIPAAAVLVAHLLGFT